MRIAGEQQTDIGLYPEADSIPGPSGSSPQAARGTSGAHPIAAVGRGQHAPNLGESPDRIRELVQIIARDDDHVARLEKDGGGLETPILTLVLSRGRRVERAEQPRLPLRPSRELLTPARLTNHCAA